MQAQWSSRCGGCGCCSRLMRDAWWFLTAGPRLPDLLFCTCGYIPARWEPVNNELFDLAPPTPADVASVAHICDAEASNGPGGLRIVGHQVEEREERSGNGKKKKQTENANLIAGTSK